MSESQRPSDEEERAIRKGMFAGVSQGIGRWRVEHRLGGGVPCFLKYAGISGHSVSSERPAQDRPPRWREFCVEGRAF